MQCTPLYKLKLAIAVLSLVGVTFLSFHFIAQAKQDQRIALTGQIVPLIGQAHLLGAANGQQQLNLSIGLQLRNQQELEYLLNNIYDPRSSLYHHFLTPEQFVTEFGPTQDQQQQVISYLRSQGLTVTSVAPNGLLIDARATVALAQTAFQVTINNYQVGAHTFYANAGASTIPGSHRPGKEAPVFLSGG